MKNATDPILGVTAPRAKPTIAGAFWLATIISIPVGVIGLVGELAWRWAF